ncbi:hypothetical protein ACFQ78_33555 [Streptomyces sp. NPDC056519]|uniref:hypothetical protein n=1 Tax=Streptomyces sp. NPDC056519 TaxID=3345849 RepID=UPI00367A6D17
MDRIAKTGIATIVGACVLPGLFAIPASAATVPASSDAVVVHPGARTPEAREGIERYWTPEKMASLGRGGGAGFRIR